MFRRNPFLKLSPQMAAELKKKSQHLERNELISVEKEAAVGASELLQLTEGHSWADQAHGRISLWSYSKNITQKSDLALQDGRWWVTPDKCDSFQHKSNSEMSAVQKELKF